MIIVVINCVIIAIVLDVGGGFCVGDIDVHHHMFIENSTASLVEATTFSYKIWTAVASVDVRRTVWRLCGTVA